MVLVVSLLVTVIDAGQNKLTPCALRHSTSFSLQSNLALGNLHTRHIAATGTSRSRDWYHWDTTRRIAVLNCDICPTFQRKLTRLIVCIAPRQTLCSHRVRHACWFLLLMLMWRVQRALFLWIKAAPLMRSDKQATSLLRKSTLGWKSFVLIKF